jgi:AAHS family 4-hydroxybenzoate transporter-like MFS transporter
VDCLAAIPPDASFTVSEEAIPGVPVPHLFTHRRAAGTCLLWMSCFAAFLMLVTNQSWAPTLLQRAGIDAAHASIAVAMFAFGSVLGTSIAGFLVGRFGAHVMLPIVQLAGGLSLGAVGYASPSVALVTGLEGLAGLFLGLASSGLIAFATSFYPTAIRSTGLGWAMGFGRFGSFVGPLVIGLLVAGDWPIESTFVALAAPALAATLLASVLPRTAVDPAQTASPIAAA